MDGWMELCNERLAGLSGARAAALECQQELNEVVQKFGCLLFESLERLCISSHLTTLESPKMK